MRRVIIESPLKGNTQEQLDDNIDYARRAMYDAIQRGEVPIAAHLLYTQVLDDTDPQDRHLGIELGLQWVHVVHACVVYNDRGISPGMKIGIARAEAYGLPIEYRSIG